MDFVFSQAALFGMLTSILLCLIMPLVCILLLKFRFKAKFLAFVAGTASYFMFGFIGQYLRQMILNALSSGISSGTALAVNVVITCLIIGLFEESARYLGLRFLFREQTLSDGLMYGAGQGGIEAFFSGINRFPLYAMALTINADGYAATLRVFEGTETGVDAARQQFDAWLSTPAYEYWAVGLDCLVSLALFAALGALAYMAVVKDIRLFPLAVLLRAVNTIPATLLEAETGTPFLLLKCAAYALAAATIFLVFTFHKRSGLPGLQTRPDTLGRRLS